MGVFLPSIANFVSDPMDIIYNPNSFFVADYAGFQLTEIAFLLRTAGLLASIISICWCLIKLLFTHGPQQVAEEKAEISHRFYIIWLLFSCVFLFNFAFQLTKMFL